VSAFRRVGAFLGVERRAACKVSSSTHPWFAFRGVYCENLGDMVSLGLVYGVKGGLLSLNLSFSGVDSALTWFWNSLNSSSYINLATLLLSSTKSDAGFLQRLFTNGSSQSIFTMWWRGTSGLRLRICIACFPNLSMNARSDSPLSCLTLRRVKDVKWCGLLVANWVLKSPTKISKQSIERGGRRVNQVNVTTLQGNELYSAQHCLIGHI